MAGAEISGLDLSKSLCSKNRDAILSALNEHHVLVFRSQTLSKKQHINFTQQFGELEEHVGRLPDGSRYPIVHTVTNLAPVSGKLINAPHTHGNYFWHTDKSYHAVPSLMTLLYAVDVPQTGEILYFVICS